VGVITDITDFKKTEEALKESKARFEDLSKASFEAVVFMENGIVTDANRRFNELFGYDNSEIIGKTGLDIIVPEALTGSMKTADMENREAYEAMGQKRDGAIFPIEIHPREVHARGKSVKTYVIRDLSEQKNMEEEILKSKNLQSIGTLAGGIAHDLITSLWLLSAIFLLQE
jgi:PAS domain S-box-containing protein